MTATAAINKALNGQSVLARDLRHMIDEADRFLKSAAESGDQTVDAVRERFVSQVAQMREQLDELESAALHKARHAVRNADHSVHEHPYGAMGFAAAVGLLVGFLAARR